jgi:hypothetical protein
VVRGMTKIYLPNKHFFLNFETENLQIVNSGAGHQFSFITFVVPSVSYSLKVNT